jgi:hypothetical protein
LVSHLSVLPPPASRGCTQALNDFTPAPRHRRGAPQRAVDSALLDEAVNGLDPEGVPGSATDEALASKGGTMFLGAPPQT